MPADRWDATQQSAGRDVGNAAETLAGSPRGRRHPEAQKGPALVGVETGIQAVGLLGALGNHPELEGLHTAVAGTRSSSAGSESAGPTIPGDRYPALPSEPRRWI